MCLNFSNMPRQIELFKKDRPGEKGVKHEPKFDMVIEGFGTRTIEKTKKPHECFACNLPIEPGSKAEKSVPVVDERPQWQYARYRHLLPACPLPEDEPA